MNFNGDAEVYRRQMTRLCEGAKKLNIPLEINLLGIRDHRAYPREDFFRIAADTGCQAILGSDAHSPDVVCDAPSIIAAEKLAEKLSLELVDRAALRGPKTAK